MRHYRRRKKQDNESKKEMEDMELFIDVDLLLENIKENMRSPFSSLLWKNLDNIDGIEQKRAMVALVNLAMNLRLKS